MMAMLTLMLMIMIMIMIMLMMVMNRFYIHTLVICVLVDSIFNRATISFLEFFLLFFLFTIWFFFRQQTLFYFLFRFSEILFSNVILTFNLFFFRGIIWIFTWFFVLILLLFVILFMRMEWEYLSKKYCYYKSYH